MELVHARKWWPRPAYLSSRVASDARVPECLTRVGYRTHPSRRFPPTYLPSAGFLQAPATRRSKSGMQVPPSADPDLRGAMY